MASWKKPCALLVAGLFVTFAAGCGDSSSGSGKPLSNALPTAKKSETAKSSASQTISHVPRTGSPQLAVDPSQAKVDGAASQGFRRLGNSVPKVLLSEQHATSCRVAVGDAMPQLTVADLGGNQQSLDSLLGKNLTVVCFWNGDHPLAQWQLADLGPDVATKFSSRGVNVVAIHHGESTSEIKELAQQAGAVFPVLVDEGGAAFDQVASGSVSRTFLLDADGKILWLDLQYSEETRRHLLQAILASLGS